MTTSFQTCWTVARWEFFRYFKLRDQLIGLASLLVGAVIGFVAVHLSRSSSQVEIGLLGESAEFQFPEKGRLRRAPGSHDEAAWRELIEAGKVDGLLKISALAGRPWSAELIVRKEPAWLAELRPIVEAEKMQWEVQEAKIDPSTVTRILTPSKIDVVSLSENETSTGDRWVAYGMVAAMLITSWIGLAYMMTGITGEKQQRVTEQIVSAIRPQAWIDGKLIGITGASIGSLAFLLVTAVISIPAGWLVGMELPLPESLKRWEMMPVFFLFYLGGVLLWNCFYAAVASVINDPNTSSRTSLLFLPMLPMMAAGLVASQPDGWMMRMLSLIPGASSTAMPMRMILGEVGFLEILLSIGFLIIGIIALRGIAGRIFAAGIMLYGKEPSWFDILRWSVARRMDMQAGR